MTDFGLAKGGTDASRSQASHAGSSEQEDGLTESGVVLGTPRYMAPEQHRGKPLTAAADQFSFCVALWEALVGEPPFSGKGFARRKDDGPPQWPPALAPVREGLPNVPRPIVDAVRAGLAADPTKRWPSVDALLQVLAHDPARTRKRWGAMVGGLAVLGLCGASLQVWATARARQCTGAQEKLAGVWDDARREEVRAAMLGVGASYVEPVWAQVSTELDGYADDWVALQIDACEASTVRGEQSAEVMDLRMGCLYRAKRELNAVTTVLATADAEVTKKAHEIVGDLRPLSRCEDTEALRAEVEPPLPAEAEAVEEIQERLARAHAELISGRLARAGQELDEAEERAAGIDYGPARAEVELERGRFFELAGQYEQAEGAYRRALESATRGRQFDAMRAAALRLMFVVGYRQRRVDESLRYRELVAGLARGNPDDDWELKACLGDVLFAKGEFDEAETEYRRAVALIERELGSADLSAPGVLNRLGLTLLERGDFAAAEAQHRRALALSEEVLGPEHPEVAGTLANIATVLWAQGRSAEAESVQRRSLALLEKALGPEHPDVAASCNNLALALQRQGRNEEAEPEQRRALAIAEKTLGPDHPAVGSARNNLALILQGLGRHEAAEAEYRRSLALWEKALGPEHPHVGGSRHNLAGTLSSQGKLAEAEAEYRRALEIREKGLGAQHLDVAATRSSLAGVLLQLGQVEEALGLAEQAWVRDQQDDVRPKQRAYTAFALARALQANTPGPEDRQRARSLAEQALGGFQQAGEADDKLVKEVRAFLARLEEL